MHNPDRTICLRPFAFVCITIKPILQLELWGYLLEETFPIQLPLIDFGLPLPLVKWCMHAIQKLTHSAALHPD